MHAANIDNALVSQKNEIIERINDATNSDDLERVAHLIDFSAPLWAALGYGYKTAELNERFCDRVRELIAYESAYLEICPKNQRTRRKLAEQHINQLEALVSE